MQSKREIAMKLDDTASSIEKDSTNADMLNLISSETALKQAIPQFKEDTTATSGDLRSKTAISQRSPLSKSLINKNAQGLSRS